MRRTLGAALLVLAAASAACGQPSPSPSPAATPALPSSPSAAPESPSGAPARHADPALEALLPEVLGGISLTRESQRGSELERQSGALDELLASVGRTLADFTLASAYSPSGDLEAQVGVWRIAGAPTDTLLPGFVKAVQSSSTTPLTVSETTIAGRTVTQVGAAGQLTQGPLYAFARGDMILFVQTPDPALAAEALAAIH